MPRSVLPQNYIVDDGTILEDFEDISDWTPSTNGDGVVSADSVKYKTGTKSLKFVVSNAKYVSATKTISIGVIKPRSISLWVYLHSDRTTSGQIYIRLSSNAEMSKYLQAVANTYGSFWLHEGWNQCIMHERDFVSTGGESWDNAMIRLRVLVYSVSGQTVEVSLDDLRYDAERIPSVLLTFDDARDSAFTNAYPIMAAANLKGTVYVISDSVGTSGTMTEENLTALYAAGWDPANHSVSHVDLTGLTEAQVVTELETCSDWLVAHGYPRAAYHHAYPLSAYNDTVRNALTTTGQLSARTTNPGYVASQGGNLHALRARDVTRTVTAETVCEYVDNAIEYQSALILLFHSIIETPLVSTDWSIANFQTLVDYLVARRVKCVTIDEWYRGLTDPRFESLLLSRAA